MFRQESVFQLFFIPLHEKRYEITLSTDKWKNKVVIGLAECSNRLVQTVKLRTA